MREPRDLRHNGSVLHALSTQHPSAKRSQQQQRHYSSGRSPRGPPSRHTGDHWSKQLVRIHCVLQIFELVPKILCALCPLVGILRQASSHDQRQISRQRWVDFRDWPWRISKNAGDRGDTGIALEWAPACRHLVQHHSQREDVRSGIGMFPFRLLRRHIRDSPFPYLVVLA
jgi:hypothetical protein